MHAKGRELAEIPMCERISLIVKHGRWQKQPECCLHAWAAITFGATMHVLSTHIWSRACTLTTCSSAPEIQQAARYAP